MNKKFFKTWLKVMFTIASLIFYIGLMMYFASTNREIIVGIMFVTGIFFVITAAIADYLSD